MLGHKSTGKSLSRTGQLCVIERTSSVADVAALSEIAQMLDYRDPSNFCRAFQRWTGQSPMRWRKAVLQQGGSLTRPCKY